MATERVLVIGGGHNGLVAAAYLAKAGRDVTLLERSDVVGGILRNSQVAPGFIAPGIAHPVGRLRRSVITDLKLPAFGLESIEPEVRVFAPQPDGSAVTFWSDAAKTAEGLKPRHARDAAAYPAFDKKVRAVATSSPTSTRSRRRTPGRRRSPTRSPD
jgi:phytoene dehydrogenase-like protein